MTENKIISKVLIFIFGFSLGGFVAVALVREAVPLRDHIYVMIVYIIYVFPIFIGLFFWYKSVIRSIRKFVGDEKADFYASLFSFFFVSLIVIFILTIGLFYTSLI